ncbi:tetratricopeptide repeat-containing diguanylate cyclase [Alteromonas ponticola]|uniref:diguanylate cyclase n=1 Tax=Alteromonas ponticola TaxID=2720613 RepID=A0ABX1R0L8_9ALTE|nr:GGDEF domain-containing protein [Alteromonas ponticola]NMH59441.1 GGDEF domain-containing protein [Alteromonas ponticola]
MSAASYAADYSALLKEADRFKSRDPKLFATKLETLRTDLAHFDAYEKDYFTYLDGYRIGFAGEPKIALQYYLRVIANTANIELKIKVLAAAINIQAIVRNYLAGYAQALTLLELLPQGNLNNRIEAYAILAIFYNQIDEFSLGLDASNKVLGLTDDARTLCFAQTTKLEANFNLGNIEQFDQVNAAIEICERANEYAPASMNIVTKAKLLKQKGQVEAALEYLLSREQAVKKSRYPVAISSYEAELAELYWLTGDAVKAYQHANLSIQQSSGAGLYKSRIQAYETLFRYAESVGDESSALDTLKKLTETEKAFLDEAKVKQLAIQQAKIDAIEKANQIKLLDKENSLLKTEAVLARTEIENNRLVIVTLFLLSSLVVIWLLVNRKMQRQLKQQAQTDELTGVPNRHHFSQLAASSLAYHKKTQQVLTLVVFDLDYFKHINDSYGHLIGDWALKAVIEAIQEVLREQDVIGRLGGEEFGILLPGCTLSKARSITEKCREAIEAIDTSQSGEQFKITASFGIADTQVCGYTFETLYANADLALYKSKKEGRNRVFVFDSSEQNMRELVEQAN